MNRWIWFQKLTLLQRPVDVVLLQGPVNVVLTWLNLESKTLWQHGDTILYMIAISLWLKAKTLINQLIIVKNKTKNQNKKQKKPYLLPVVTRCQMEHYKYFLSFSYLTGYFQLSEIAAKGKTIKILMNIGRD